VQFADGAQDVKEPFQQPSRPQSTRGEASEYAHTPSGPWQMVEFASSGESPDDRKVIQLPAIERDKLDADWLKKLPAAIPADVLQALQRTGHRVQRRRELLPYRMQDGRQLVMPVDVYYVGNPAL
jgi:hypothetical protein